MNFWLKVFLIVAALVAAYYVLASIAGMAIIIGTAAFVIVLGVFVVRMWVKQRVQAVQQPKQERHASKIAERELKQREKETGKF